MSPLERAMASEHEKCECQRKLVTEVREKVAPVWGEIVAAAICQAKQGNSDARDWLTSLLFTVEE